MRHEAGPSVHSRYGDYVRKRKPGSRHTRASPRLVYVRKDFYRREGAANAAGLTKVEGHSAVLASSLLWSFQPKLTLAPHDAVCQEYH